jgi:DNA-directed RNA polymerase subunit RPC12/RpoP
MPLISYVEVCPTCGEEVEGTLDSSKPPVVKCTGCKGKVVLCHLCTAWEEEDVSKCEGCANGSNFNLSSNA